MPVKDPFEMLVKIFHRNGTQFVKDPANLHAIIGVRILSIPGGHQQPIGLGTVLVQIRRVVMAISQNEADFSRNLAQQSGSRLAIGDIGGSQHSSNGKPNGGDDRNHVQFPAIDESTASQMRVQWASGSIEL
jgi:hypothetical protein